VLVQQVFRGALAKLRFRVYLRAIKSVLSIVLECLASFRELVRVLAAQQHHILYLLAFLFGECLFPLSFELTERNYQIYFAGLRHLLEHDSEALK
jgi:hypothetical protein